MTTTTALTHLTRSGRPCRIVRSGATVCTIQYAGSDAYWSYATNHLRPVLATLEAMQYEAAPATEPNPFA